MKINQSMFDTMPEDLRKLFTKLPNPAREEVVAGFPESKSHSGGTGYKTYTGKRTGKEYAQGDNDATNIYEGGFKVSFYRPGYMDSETSAARFFYTAKASKRDRNEGCETLEERQSEAKPEREYSVRNHHPTVKPTELMRYLCRLITPTSGKILDPFAGSGSTGKAAIWEGFDFVGIELEADHVTIAEARLNHAVLKSEEETRKNQIQPSLFGKD